MEKLDKIKELDRRNRTCVLRNGGGSISITSETDVSGRGGKKCPDHRGLARPSFFLNNVIICGCAGPAAVPRLSLVAASRLLFVAENALLICDGFSHFRA